MNILNNARILLTIFMITTCPFVMAQDRAGVNLEELQKQHKSKEYITFDLQPLFRVGVKVFPSTGNQVFSQTNAPGFAVGADYYRVGRSGFTVLAGLHFRMIPLNYKFDFSDADFPGLTNNFGKRSAHLNNGHFYFPIQAGYTLQKEPGKWQPSLTAGITVSSIQNSIFGSEFSYYNTTSKSQIPIQRFRVAYAEQRPWVGYRVNVRASKTLKKGNQIFAASPGILLSNITQESMSYIFQEALKVDFFQTMAATWHFSLVSHLCVSITSLNSSL